MAQTHKLKDLKCVRNDEEPLRAPVDAAGLLHWEFSAVSALQQLSGRVCAPTQFCTRYTCSENIARLSLILFSSVVKSQMSVSLVSASSQPQPWKLFIFKLDETRAENDWRCSSCCSWRANPKVFSVILHYSTLGQWSYKHMLISWKWSILWLLGEKVLSRVREILFQTFSFC